ncbi:MAG: hypothetical protein ABJQ78_13810 [Alloalcanivorax sp.]
MIEDTLLASDDAYEYGSDYAVNHWTRIEKKARLETMREFRENTQRGFSDLARIMATNGNATAKDALAPFVKGANKAFGPSRAAFEWLVDKAAYTSLTGIWDTEGGERIAQNYLASVRNADLLGSLLAYSKELPEDLGAVVAASGAIGSNVDEGDPKPLVKSSLNRSNLPELKVAGLAAISKELGMTTGSAGRRMFENELRNAVVGGSNSTIQSVATPASTITATSDTVADLTSLLEALPNSEHYVIASTGAVCRRLAMASDNGMSVNGGEFIPGVHVVPCIEDDSSAPALLGFACDRIAVANGGLFLTPATHASVELAESPTSPAQLTSLWQTNMVGVLCERRFRFHHESEAVVQVM